jgi:hypothetical protein
MVKLGRGRDVFGEAERHPFCAIDWAAPTQAHQDVCVHGSGTRRGGDHIRPWRVLCNRIEDLNEARPENLLHPPQQVSLGGNRRTGNDERPLAAQAIDFGGKLCDSTFPKNDPLLWEKREGALQAGCELHTTNPFLNNRQTPLRGRCQQS